jgi:hypothetical protein
MRPLPPPSGQPVQFRQRHPVYRLADWFERNPHYGAGIVALLVLVVFWPILGPIISLFW